jgi:uncharacterized OB-fold protein
MSYNKPLPVPDPESAPFWEGAKAHKLMIQRCASTGAYQFPPTTFCQGAGLERPEWVQASGKGKVFSWIVVRHPVPKDIYASEVPYAVALVTLEEGCRVTGNIIGVDVDDITADMPVQVSFRDVTDDITLPVFEPAKVA